jgi:hypothetical protein
MPALGAGIHVFLSLFKAMRIHCAASTALMRATLVV